MKIVPTLSSHKLKKTKEESEGGLNCPKSSNKGLVATPFEMGQRRHDVSNSSNFNPTRAMTYGTNSPSRTCFVGFLMCIGHEVLKRNRKPTKQHSTQCLPPIFFFFCPFGPSLNDSDALCFLNKNISQTSHLL